MFHGTNTRFRVDTAHTFNTATSCEMISSDFVKLLGVLPQSQVNNLLAGVQRISLIQPETNG